VVRDGFGDDALGDGIDCGLFGEVDNGSLTAAAGSAIASSITASTTGSS
jgi:hypothetical protein